MTEESNLSRSFPTKFMYEHIKVLDWKWFKGRNFVGAVLIFDLNEKRLRGILGCPYDFFLGEDQEKEAIKAIICNGCILPTDMSIIIFQKYFSQECVMKNLDKNFRLFLQLTEILDEK